MARTRHIPTLFDGEYEQAIRDFIAEFQRQLKTAQSKEEREEILIAIRSYQQALEPPKQPRRKR